MKDNTVGSLTQRQRSIVIGSILGDGYVRIMPGRADAFLEINHSISQKEYVDWKHRELKSICRSLPVARRGNGNRIAYRFFTKQHPDLTELYRLFYKGNMKIIPRRLVLDPLTIAVWFMDDGSKCRDSDIYLNTQQFEMGGQHNLVRALSLFGIECSLNRDKIYWRLRIKKSSLPVFWKAIAHHIIPSMNYKLSYNPVETCS